MPPAFTRCTERVAGCSNTSRRIYRAEAAGPWHSTGHTECRRRAPVNRKPRTAPASWGVCPESLAQVGGHNTRHQERRLFGARPWPGAGGPHGHAVEMREHGVGGDCPRPLAEPGKRLGRQAREHLVAHEADSPTQSGDCGHDGRNRQGRRFDPASVSPAGCQPKALLAGRASATRFFGSRGGHRLECVRTTALPETRRTRAASRRAGPACRRPTRRRWRSGHTLRDRPRR